MKHYEIYFTITGPGGTKEIPNFCNPVPSDNLYGVVKSMGDYLKTTELYGIPIEIVGLKIIKVS